MPVVEQLNDNEAIIDVGTNTALIRLHLNCNGVHAIALVGVLYGQYFFTVRYHRRVIEL